MADKSDVVTSISLEFKDMDVWVAEQEAKAAAEEAKKKANSKPIEPATAPPAKKAKNVVDIEALAVERLAVEEMGDTNWIGLLQQYRDVHPVAGAANKGLTWTEYQSSASLNPCFTCTLAIAECPDEAFGNNPIGFTTKTVTFSTKKLARKYAAKCAIDWLIKNGRMPADGTVKFPKLAAATSSAAPALGPPDSNRLPPSYATRVPEICNRLGFSVPSYTITSDIANANGPLWNGSADFGHDPRIDGQVGVVTKVYGKKKCKEEVAKLVYSFMRDIERGRLGEREGACEDEEDKKRKRAAETGSPATSQEGAAKLVKV